MSTPLFDLTLTEEQRMTREGMRKMVREINLRPANFGAADADQRPAQVRRLRPQQ